MEKNINIGIDKEITLQLRQFDCIVPVVTHPKADVEYFFVYKLYLSNRLFVDAAFSDDFFYDTKRKLLLLWHFDNVKNLGKNTAASLYAYCFSTMRKAFVSGIKGGWYKIGSISDDEILYSKLYIQYPQGRYVGVALADLKWKEFNGSSSKSVDENFPEQSTHA